MFLSMTSTLRTTTAALVLGLTGLLAAPAPVAMAQSDLQGEIRFSWWGGPQRNEKTYDVLELFESEHPGVSIVREPSDFSGYWQKSNVQAAGNNLPCVMGMQNRYLANYDDPDILLPLDDLVADGTLDLTGIPTPLVDSGRGEDGNLYMIPAGVFFYVMLMNQTVADGTGVPAPDPTSYTWDEFKAWLIDISAEMPEGVTAIDGVAFAPEAFSAYVRSHGQSIFKDGGLGFDEQIVADWFNYWHDLREAGVLQSADRMVEERNDMIEESGIANGRLMIQSRPANRLDAHQKILDTARPGETLHIILYPMGPDGAGEDVGINGLSIAAACEGGDRDIATAWINFFVQDDRAARIYASDNGVVSVDRFQDAQYADPDATTGQREQIDALRIVAQRAKPAHYPTGGFAALNTALKASYERVAFGRSTPEEAAADMVREMQRAIR